MSNQVVRLGRRSVFKLAALLGFAAALTGCVVPPHQGYGYGGSYSVYAQSPQVVVQPRPVYIQPRPVYVPPQPVYVQPQRLVPAMPAPAVAPRPREGGWGWNTTQRERLEHRFDAPRQAF